jgi:predicted nucleic acid-binding Zn ribbon protein
MSEKRLILCLECFDKGTTQKMQLGPGGGIGIHFKGKGFYETDYKNKG